MESWMVSLGVGIITYISLFVTMKNKVDNHQRLNNLEENVKDLPKIRIMAKALAE